MVTSDKSPSRMEPEVIAQLRAARIWLRFLVDSLDLDPDRTAMLFPAGLSAGRQDVAVEVVIAQRGRPVTASGEMDGRRVTLAHSLAQIDAALAEAARG